MQGGDVRQLLVGCKGGLGNQLFQYAAGKYFATKLSCSLQIVRPHVKRNHSREKYPRPFQLDAFSLDTPIVAATAEDRLFLSPRPQLVNLRHRIGRLTGKVIVEEPTLYRFLPGLLDTVHKNTVYLAGYWQAASYVECNAEELRRSLELRNEPLPRNLNYSERIRGLTCPVSLHVRGGDYATHAAISWVLPASYYRAAIAYIRGMLPDVSFVVFTDDREVARQVVGDIDAGLWIEGNSTDHAYEELWLMSICKHHIIANSSFSWWGAWLNPAADKQVVAPKCWLNSRDSYFPELYPSGWILIDHLYS